MRAQQALLVKHFEELGGAVELQEFSARHPVSGEPVAMANLIARWHTERTERILLCAHYDTRPFPDRDPLSPRGVFVGANDGASGVAVLMTLAERLATLPGRHGVDVALFDGEEFIFPENLGMEQDLYFRGSEYFAREYVSSRPGYRYRYGVLLDMVGDADLSIPQEGTMLAWRDTRPLAQQIWGVARQLGVREFVAREGPPVRDDHLMLHDIGKIPCVDLIDFTYDAWHTEGDTPARCSALSLAKVGWVAQTWLERLK
jgi:glutaminyl-peptide cyclotransferase